MSHITLMTGVRSKNALLVQATLNSQTVPGEFLCVNNATGIEFITSIHWACSTALRPQMDSPPWVKCWD